MFAAFLFVALARFRCRPFGTIRFFASPADACFFFGAFAFFGIAQLRTGERLSACITLVIGERAQDNAG